jgi:hypothetical protein
MIEHFSPKNLDLFYANYVAKSASATMQQYLRVPKDYPLVMATETKPVVALFVNLLVRVDIEKAYKIGVEVAEDSNALFQGVLPWAMAPNRDVEYLSFITDVDSMNKIIEKVKSGLNLTEENLLYTVTPALRPKEKPVPSIMTT